MRKLFLTILFILCFAVPVQTAEYTIDNGDGEVITESVCGGECAGDTIRIDGARTDPIYFDSITGTSGSYVTIINDSTAKVTISGNTTQYANCIVFIDCRYFKLLGNGYGSETYGIKLTNGNGLKIIRGKDYEIAFVELSGTTSGVAQNNNFTWTESDGPIQNVNLHHIYVHDTTGYEAFYYGMTSEGDYPYFENLQIHDNILENIYRDCIQVGYLTGTNNNVYKNEMSECGLGHDSAQSFGIISYLNVEELEIYQNYIDGVAKNGIQIDGDVEGPVSIHDNIVVDAGNYFTGQGIKVDGDYAHSIVNNTIIGPSQYGIKSEVGSSGSIKYNLLPDSNISSSFTKDENKCTSGCEYSATGVPAENFGANYRLTSISPAVNQGSGATGYSTTDIDGNTRPYDSTNPDIGAHEFVGAAPPPITISNINGPGAVTISNINGPGAITPSY